MRVAMRMSIVVCIGAAACAHPSSVARPGSAPPDALGITEKIAIAHACGAGWAPLTEEPADKLAVDTRARPPDDVVISRVAIAGVDPALAGTLEAALATRPGMTFGDAPLKDDLAHLLAMGITADASIETDFDPKAPPANEVRGSGLRAAATPTAAVTFRLAPEPTIDAVELHGETEVMRRFALLRGAAFEPRRLWRMANALAQDYVRDGHLDASVVVAHARRGAHESICVFAHPGPRVTVASVTFPGRKQLPEAALRGVMHTEKFNHPGALYDQDQLDVDQLYLSALYWDHGYANVKVGSPRLIRHGAHLSIELPITEGGLYTFGELHVPRGLHTKLAAKPGDRFSRTAVMELRDAVAAELDTDVDVRSHVDEDHARIDITLEPHWRWPWQGLAHALLH